MLKPRWAGRLLGLSSLCVLALVACGPPPAPVVGPPPPSDYFEGRSFATTVQQAREALLGERRSRRWKSAPRKLFLPPLGDGSSPAALSALSWWTLRFESGLLPWDEVEIGSVAELQAFSRRESNGSEYWLLDSAGSRPLRLEWVVVKDGHVLRSGEFEFWEGDAFDEWPLESTRAVSRVAVEGARAFVRSDASLLVESEDGRTPLRIRRGRLELQQRRPMPVGRPHLPPLPTLEVQRDDLRLIWSQRVQRDGSCSEGWSVARQGAEMSLPLQRRAGISILGLESLASTDGERWAVLREDGGIELHPVSMRVSSRVRPVSSTRRRAIALSRSASAGTTRGPLVLWQREPTQVPLRFLAAALDPSGRSWVCDSAEEARRITAQFERKREQFKLHQLWGWLVGPMELGSLRASGERIVFESKGLPSDLLARLDHPALWIDLPQGLADELAEGLGNADAPGGDRAALECDWPREVGVGAPPPDGATTVGILLSAVAPSVERQRIAGALTGLGLPQLFAVDAPEWEPRAPATGRPWPPFVAGEPSEAPPHLVLDVDPTVLGKAERERLLRRLEVVLGEDGIRMTVTRSGHGPAGYGAGTVQGSLTRLALYSQDALLRALELGSWCGRAGSEDVEERLLRLPPGDLARRGAAELLEDQILRSAVFVGLWREHWSCEMDGRLRVGQSWNPLLPPWLGGLHWHPSADFSSDASEAEPGR